ncbi:MAG: Lrp/AsnC family transcriptional regulator [Candidatus Hodarchaeota archaeon]
MDDRDKVIVDTLLENARISRSKIARKLQISEAAVRKRITKLENDGAIFGYRAVVNQKKIGYLASLTGIDVAPEHLWKAIDKLKKKRQVRSIFLSSGDHTIMIEIWAKSAGELSRIHKDLENIEGIERICPAVITERIR